MEDGKISSFRSWQGNGCPWFLHHGVLGHLFMACASLSLKSSVKAAQLGPDIGRAPKDHVSMIILRSMVSGIPLIWGSHVCGLVGL